MNPCQQAVPIAKLEVTTEQIGRTLERLGTVLEKIAEQGTRVTTLEDNQEILFSRLRDAEMNLVREQTKMWFIVSGLAAVVSAVTAAVVKFFSE